MLTITYTSKYERWVESLNLHVWSERSLRFQFILFYFVLPAACACELLLALFMPRDARVPFFDASTAWAFGFLIFSVIMWGLRATGRRTRYAKLWPPEVTDQRNVLIFSENSLTVFSNGIGESQLQWSAIRKTVRNKNMILLYVAQGSFIVVPLESLTADELQYLDALLGRHVKVSL